MMDFMFFVKTLALTILLVLFLQVKVGGKTMESHTMDWVQTSALVEPLNGVAHGAAKMIHDLTQKMYGSIHRKIKHDPSPTKHSSSEESENE